MDLKKIRETGTNMDLSAFKRMKDKHLRQIRSDLSKRGIDRIEFADSLAFLISNDNGYGEVENPLKMACNTLVISRANGYIPDELESDGCVLNAGILKRVQCLVPIGSKMLYDALKNNIYVEVTSITVDISEPIRKGCNKVKEFMNQKHEIGDGRAIETRVITYQVPESHKAALLKYARKEIIQLSSTYTRTLEENKRVYENKIATLGDRNVPEDLSENISSKVGAYIADRGIVLKALESNEIRIKTISHNGIVKNAPKAMRDLVFRGKFHYMVQYKKFYFKLEREMNIEESERTTHPHINSDGAVCLGSLSPDRSYSANAFLANIALIIKSFEDVNLDSVHGYQYITKYKENSYKLFNALKNVEADKAWSTNE